MVPVASITLKGAGVRVPQRYREAVEEHQREVRRLDRSRGLVEAVSCRTKDRTRP
jgi:hypothetical protein